MLFRYDAAGDVLVEARGAACRCCGDAQRMRAVDEAGRPVYGDGDCTQRASTAGCCDRKHWCRPQCVPCPFSWSQAGRPW